jgi:hypothetical protein
MMNNLIRLRVLQLYKRIIKLSQTWQAIDHPSKTPEEQLYIRNEARELFRKNRNVCYNYFDEEILFIFFF